MAIKQKNALQCKQKLGIVEEGIKNIHRANPRVKINLNL